MTHPFSYQGKRVAITGAYSGVGAATATLLKQLGASEVIALDIKPPEHSVDRYIETNMGDPEAVDAAAAAIDAPLDVLFNNAGIAATSAPAQVMRVNYLGLRRLSRALLPKISAGGAIVNTASIAGGQWPSHLAQILELLAIEDWDESLAWIESHSELVGDAYSFSKECVQVYTMASAKQTLAAGVRTNSVCPAPIDTPLMPDFRQTMGSGLIDWTVENSGGAMATPEDIGLTLAFLGSEAARYVNGVNLLVDSGFTAAMTTGQVDLSSLPGA